MSMDDTPPPRPMPRVVPTLTEVVGLGDAPAAEPLAAPSPAAPARSAEPVPSPLLSADELLQRLGPDLDRLISEAIGRVLHEQMLGLNGRVQRAVADVVREAVAKAMAQDGHGQPPR